MADESGAGRSSRLGWPAFWDVVFRCPGPSQIREYFIVNLTIRKLARRLVRQESVRANLNTASRALGNAIRTLRMRYFSSPGRLRESRNVKVNIGCGGLIREGWVNVDLYPGPGATYLDVLDGLPFGSGAVIRIQCEHFLEHLEFDQAERFLAECRRVLTPGGILRVVVPDAEKYLRAYCRGDEDFFNQLTHLGGAQVPLDTPVKVINQMFRMGGDHRFAWDFATLRATALTVGFAEVVQSCFGDVPAEFAIDGTDDWRRLESLYANLRK